MQLDKYSRLHASHQATERNLAEITKQLQAAKDKVTALEKDLETAGVDITKLNASLASRNTELSKLSSTLEERELALAAYKKRAEQLDRIKRRFERLRAKLRELTTLGLGVVIRNNRMVIQLPGDVLFASGKDKLKKDGKGILDKVAAIINADASLRIRDYQVAGHTDNKPFKGGVFYDNWGLSLMRARQVLLYLIDPKHGALPMKRWSAAGFADIDPVKKNDTDKGRQANRRCELIVVPSAEEMLDLNAIAQ